jgi:hypothetical protein
MHRPSHNIEEDMKFQKGLSVKQLLEIFRLEKLIMFSCVSTFEANASWHQDFFLDLHDRRTYHEGQIMFWDHGQNLLQ